MKGRTRRGGQVIADCGLPIDQKKESQVRDQKSKAKLKDTETLVRRRPGEVNGSC